jgi:hypothetical protein
MSDWGILARQEKQNAADWQAYGRKLEQELAATRANLAGNKAVKNAALQELARIDPKNFLTVRQNRQSIYDAAFYASQVGKRSV